MHSKYITVNNTTIHYLQKGFGNNVLVFIHGNSMSSQVWQHYFTDYTIPTDYSFIAIDLLGHGKSSQLTNIENYGLIVLGDIIGMFLQQLTISNYVIVAQSYASNIVAEMPYQKNCKGIVLTGYSMMGAEAPVESFLLPNKSNFSIAQEMVDKQQLLNHIDCLTEKRIPAIDDLLFNAYMQTHGLVRLAVGKAIAEKQYTDELERLTNSHYKIALLMGVNDVITKPNYLENTAFIKRVWQEKIHYLQGGHIVHIDEPEQFIAFVMQASSYFLKS